MAGDLYGYPNPIGEAEMKKRKAKENKKDETITQKAPEDILKNVKGKILEEQDYEKKLEEAFKKEGTKGIDFAKEEIKHQNELQKNLERDVARKKFLEDNKEEIEFKEKQAQENELSRIEEEQKKEGYLTINDLSNQLGISENEILKIVKRKNILINGDSKIPISEMRKLADGEDGLYQA